MWETRFWITCAATDAEAWRAIVLARSLKRSITTHPLAVLICKDVSDDLRLALEMEFHLCQLAQQVSNNHIPFSVAALQLMRNQEKLRFGVFLDPSCVVVRNCDFLFHDSGMEVVNSKNGLSCAILAPSRSATKFQLEKLFEAAIEVDCGKKFDSVLDVHSILKYCVELDIASIHPLVAPGDATCIIYFSSGHPIELETPWKPLGHIEMVVAEYVGKLRDEDMHRPLEQYPVNDCIAIVGMSCRYPGANTIPEFWDLLENGIDGIVRVPEWRWTKEHTAFQIDNTLTTEAGFLSCPIDTFDTRFFNTSASETQCMDPQQRLSLRVVWEALEHACIDPLSLKGSMTGVFGGWWRNDYKEILQELKVETMDFLRIYMGNALGPYTARIAHFLDLVGPAYSTESGCSTSIAGVDMAVDCLRNEKCNLAIAVGANLLLHPFNPNMGILEGVLAPDGRSKTFDASANGFGRAEGFGVLILKRYGEAVADGDRIWGLLRGCAVVQEGTSKSMGTPTVEVEAKAMQLALNRSQVSPDDVEFLETHGTGTPVGDPIEVAAIAKVYSVPEGRKKPLIIASVKTNIGHTESVCGITGIQKAVLAFQHDLIPKHLHLKELNPEIDLAAIPAEIPMENIPWPRRAEKPRFVTVNSFGITGAQASIIVQEPPESIPKGILHNVCDTRSHYFFTFSAKTEDAITAEFETYSKLLKDKALPPLRDVEYTLHTGRAHFQLRHSMLVTSEQELLEKIETALANKPKQVPMTIPQVGFLFTGQGSQYPGMARELYEENVVFRTTFDWCDSMLSQEYGIEGIKLIMENNEKAGAMLTTTLYSQISIFVVEYCLLRLWESWGIKPAVVLGHSLGEFAACIAAGILLPEDALKMVVTRTKLINALPKGNMLVVKQNEEQVGMILFQAFGSEGALFDIAALNSSDQTVVSGCPEHIQTFKATCEKNGTKVQLLKSSHAFHSKMMEPMLKEYEKVLQTVEFKQPNENCVFVSSVDGKPLKSLDCNYWLRHTKEKVKFLEASQQVVHSGFKTFLEIGPHPVLSTLMTENCDSITDVTCLPSLRRTKETPWETLFSTLGKLYELGVAINWNNFHRYSRAKKILDLPGYQFQESVYWMKKRDDGGFPFHPLVGAQQPNPSDVSLYRSFVHVAFLPWLKDHCIGDRIIFPACGFIEMCMTAGYAATECPDGKFVKPTTPLGIKDFNISTPLSMNEIQSTEFQTVVRKNEEGNPVATIYNRLWLDDGTFKWVKNAEANYVTMPPSDPGSILPPEILNFAELQKRISVPLDQQLDYSLLPSSGFQFGPTCQTVLRGWRPPDSPEECLFKFETKQTPEELRIFVMHPWVIDPMLQMLILSLGFIYEEDMKRRPLIVPVSMENYYWWGRTALSGYVYVSHRNDRHEGHVYDDDGNIMASMLGCEFLETTLANMMALIDAQKNPYPALAEIVWKEELGPNERRVANENLEKFNVQEEVRILKENSDNPQTPNEEKLLLCDQLARLHAMVTLQKALHDFSPKQFTINDLMEHAKFLPEMKNLLNSILHLLREEQWLDIQEEVVTLKKPLPTLEELSNRKQQLLKEPVEDDLKKFDAEWQKLPELLTGKSQLDPEFVAWLLSNSVFATEKIQPWYKHQASLLHNLWKPKEEKIHHEKEFGKAAVLRILEVSHFTPPSVTLLQTLIEEGVCFHYTFLSLSKPLLEKAKDIFTDKEMLHWAVKELEVERNLSELEFPVDHFDVILLPWNSDSNVLIGFSKFLRTNGLMTFAAFKQPLSPMLGLSLAGISEFIVDQHKPTLQQSEDLNHLTVRKYGENSQLIENLVKKNQNNTSRDQKSTWIIFGKESFHLQEQLQNRLEKANIDTVTVTRDQCPADELDTFINSKLGRVLELNPNATCLLFLWSLEENMSTRDACEPFLYICKYFASYQKPFKIIVVTKGMMCTGPMDFEVNPPAGSPIVCMLIVLANENQDIDCKCVDISDDKTDMESVFTEFFTCSDKEVAVAYRYKQRRLPRLKQIRAKIAGLTIPQSPRYRLILPPSHLFSDLYFAPCEPEPVGQGQVEIRVHCYGINFLDTLMVTKPDPIFDQYNCVGVDFAGIITAIGPGCEKYEYIADGGRVVGMRRDGFAMPSHVVIDAKYLCPIPNEITYGESAAGPLASLTVRHSIREVTEIQKEDVFLVHTASGAVGLVAIQAAMQVGCIIIATAGNERKRNFLRDMGIRYVYNSRNTDYAEEIRKAFGGPAVTLVLNSLTGPGFKEATLSVCSEKSRFIEISKMNTWSKDEVASLRPDVFYEVVDVSHLRTELYDKYVEELREETKKMIKQWREGSVDTEKAPTRLAMQTTQFPCCDVKEALDYMERVRHVGKVVVNMPDVNDKSGAKFNIFNGNSSYLVTGGLGGIGFEVAKWMISQGAQTLFLLGRSAPKPQISEEIEKLLKGNPALRIITRECDVGKWKDVEKFLKELKGNYEDVTIEEGLYYPPLRGIMHAAGVLDDGEWEQQTWEKYENVFHSKVLGGWNLHRASGMLVQPLEHFVVFSSITSTFGAAGQSNYASANYYLDQLVHYRVSRGLPGLTINWGQWAQVGMAASIQHNLYKPFSVKQGLAALEYAMRTHKTQMVAYEADLRAIKSLLPSTCGLLSEIDLQGPGKVELGIKEEEFWNDYDEQEDNEGRYQVVRKFMHKVVRNILKLGPGEDIDDHQNLQDLGVDSLSFVELKNELQSTFGKRVKISVNQVKDCRTIHQLSSRLVEIISGKEDMQPLPKDQLMELLEKDWTLPENVHVCETMATDLTPIQDVKTILLLGTTGFLGSYAFKYLFDNPRIQKIYCLMRTNALISLEDRFVRKLEQKKLYTESKEKDDKTELVSGDISKPLLGMDEDTYKKLAENVDAVINLAGNGGNEDAYREVVDDKGSNRMLNVVGFKALLEFATTAKLKHIYHTSIMAVAPHLKEDDVITDDFYWNEVPTNDQIDLIPNLGTFVSKLVSESLVRQAVERGVPVKMFRFPLVTGECGSGFNAELERQVMKRFYAYMVFGVMPKVKGPLNTMPVDICVKMSLDIFFNPETKGISVYNVANPVPGDECELAALFEHDLGVSVSVMEPEEFHEYLKKMERSSDTFELMRIVSIFEKERERLEEVNHPILSAWASGHTEIFKSKKVEAFLPEGLPSSMDIFRKELQHAKDMGVFDRYKIKYAMKPGTK